MESLTCRATARRTRKPCKHLGFIRLPIESSLPSAEPYLYWFCHTHYRTLCRDFKVVTGLGELQMSPCPGGVRIDVVP